MTWRLAPGKLAADMGENVSGYALESEAW